MNTSSYHHRPFHVTVRRRQDGALLTNLGMYTVEILGHTDIRMTKRYSHGMQERQREALEKLVSYSPRQRDAKNLKKEKQQGRALR